METYYYVEIYPRNKGMVAYNNISKMELKRLVNTYNKQVKRLGITNTMIFGKESEMYRLGKLANNIKANVKPYQTDIEYIKTNTEDWIKENFEQFLKEVSNNG